MPETSHNCLTMLLWAFAATSAATDGQTGRIQGMLGTAAGQQRYVGRAVVFICDAKTGQVMSRAGGTNSKAESRGPGL